MFKLNLIIMLTIALLISAKCSDDKSLNESDKKVNIPKSKTVDDSMEDSMEEEEGGDVIENNHINEDSDEVDYESDNEE